MGRRAIGEDFDGARDVGGPCQQIGAMGRKDERAGGGRRARQLVGRGDEIDPQHRRAGVEQQTYGREFGAGTQDDELLAAQIERATALLGAIDHPAQRVLRRVGEHVLRAPARDLLEQLGAA